MQTLKEIYQRVAKVFSEKILKWNDKFKEENDNCNYIVL